MRQPNGMEDLYYSVMLCAIQILYNLILNDAFFVFARLKGEKEEKLRALEHDLQGERDKCKSIEIKVDVTSTSHWLTAFCFFPLFYPCLQ